MEGSGVGSAGCGVHVDMHGEWSYVVGGCNVMNMADILCLNLVLQATPFPHSANAFSKWHAEGRSIRL